MRIFWYPRISKFIRTLFRITFLLITILLLANCKTDPPPPKGVPAEAEYNRKENLYRYNSDGVLSVYTKTGELYYRCPVDQQEVLHGKCQYLFPPTGVVTAEGSYFHGSRDGLWYWDTADGILYIKQSFSKDRRRDLYISQLGTRNEDGPYTRYYPDGTIEVQGNYSGGYRSGKWISYYRSGKVEFEGVYKEEKPVGIWRFYYPSGEAEAVEEYTSAGELIERKLFLPDGSLRCKVTPENTDCR